MDEILAQITLLTDCLRKKEEALNVIIAFTNKQTDLIVNSPKDNASFNELAQKKLLHIEYVNDLDNIFTSIFDRVKDFMGKGNEDHREVLIKLKDGIKAVTDLTVTIKTLEEKNARMIAGGVRKPPKKIVSANHAVNAYRRNKKG